MEFVQLALLVVFVEAVTEILVAAKITDGFRNFIFSKAHPNFDKEDAELTTGPWLWRFFNDLLSCGYCTSVWVSFGAAILSPRWFLVQTPFIGWMVNWLVMVFVLHRISNWLHVAFSIIKKGRVKTYDIEIVHKHQVNDGSTGQIGSQESPAS